MINLSAYCLSACLPVWLTICLHTCLSLCTNGNYYKPDKYDNTRYCTQNNNFAGKNFGHTSTSFMSYLKTNDHEIMPRAVVTPNANGCDSRPRHCGRDDIPDSDSDSDSDSDRGLFNKKLHTKVLHQVYIAKQYEHIEQIWTWHNQKYLLGDLY